LADSKMIMGLALCVLLACASDELRSGTTLLGSGTADLGQSQGDTMHLELIERMLASGRVYAVLAHLDALPVKDRDAPRAQWLRAEALRQMQDHATATQLYVSLMEGPYAGLAHRGLGLVASSQGQSDTALRHFEIARGLLPTDSRVRNDLGYACLLAGDIARARTELLTALELDPHAATVTANFLLFLHSIGDVRAATAWAERRSIPADQQEDVRKEAARIAAAWPSARAGARPQFPARFSDENESRLTE